MDRDMIAMDVLVNGEHRLTMVAPDLGMLTAHISWTRFEVEAEKVFESAYVRGDFHHHRGQDASFSGVGLKVGDEVTIRLVNLNATPGP